MYLSARQYRQGLKLRFKIMKQYEVQVVNPMMSSIKQIITAKNENDAKSIASKLFGFKGDWKYIIVKGIE